MSWTLHSKKKLTEFKKGKTEPKVVKMTLHRHSHTTVPPYKFGLILNVSKNLDTKSQEVVETF